jgi:hypothetical protein
MQIVQAQRWLEKNQALVAKNDYSGSTTRIGIPR